MLRSLLILCLFTTAQNYELQYRRECLTTIALSDHAECHGPDKQHLVCTGLIITAKADCEIFHAIGR
jgi:hypothetical protein